MDDFMCWLYTHYIEPQILLQPKDDGDQFRASLLQDETTPQEREDVAALLRFYASHAFLLGLRTGIGLGPTLQ